MFEFLILYVLLGFLFILSVYLVVSKHILKRQFLLQFSKQIVIEKHIGFAAVEIKTGKVLQVNSVLQELLKINFEQIKNKTIIELFGIEASVYDEIVHLNNERGKIVYFNLSGNQFIGRVQVLPKISQQIIVLSFTVEALNRNYQVSPHNILEDLHDYATDIIYRQDVAAKSWNFLSSAVETITGHPMSSFVTGGVENFINLIHPDDLPAIASHFEKIYAANKHNYPEGNINYRLRTPNGNYVHLNDRHTFIFDETGNVSHIIGVARNVSNDNLATEELKSQSQFWQQIYNSSEDALFILKQDDLKVVSFNLQAQKMFDFENEALIGNSLYTICSDSGNYSYNNLIKLFPDINLMQKTKYNWEFVAKNKAVFPAEISVFPAKEGNLNRYFIVIRNIQHLVDLKNRLTTILNRNHSYMEFMPTAAFEINADGIIIDSNKEAEVLTGLEKNEIIGIALKDLITDKQALGINIEWLKEGKKTEQAFIFDKAKNKKHVIKLNLNKTNENTYLVFCSNITDTVLFEETIHAIEELYKNRLSGNLVLGLIELLRKTLNADFLMLAAANNNAQTKTLVVNNKGRILPNFEYFVEQHTDDDEYAIAPSKSLLKELRVANYLCTKVTDSGNNNLAILTALFNNSIENERVADSLLKIFAMRISVEIEHEQNNNKIDKQTKNLENEVNTRTFQLQKINEELEKFAYIVSHDLKTHVRGIANLSSWLAVDYSHLLDDEGKNIINIMVSRAELMNELIEAILQYSRLGRITESMEVIDLKLLIEEVIQVLQVPPHIKVSLPQRLPQIYAEKVRIMQLFQNLLGNAVKFNDKAAGLVEINVSENTNLYEFTVFDNGPGIPAKYQAKAFEIFQKVHDHANKSGTGIGLTVVKRIVELYGGTIRIESDGTNGTAFVFSLSKEKVDLQQIHENQNTE
ncbi:MAG TPA: hypothetical protein DCQ31_06090 [Bacteroidales bacterium]|nr:hypothetical protein [Bacteroidales bacterium]